MKQGKGTEIDPKVVSHGDVEIGRHSIIEEGVVLAEGVRIGDFCKIGPNVTIGMNTIVKDYVELRPGTVIENDCRIDSRVSSSGQNRVRHHTTLRYAAIIARGCDIGAHCYVCPQVMTNNVSHEGEEVGGAKVGDHCFIGTQTVLGAGIEIAVGTIIGSCSNVTKSIEERAVYLGNPAKKFRDLMKLPEWLETDAGKRYLKEHGGDDVEEGEGQ